MASPNIEGTYRLVRRVLPDGTVQTPPALKGMLSLTKEWRNFSVVWQEDGKWYSETYAARYTLTDREYRETADYLIIEDEVHGRPRTHDLEARTESSPVTVDGTCVRFALPQPFEKALGITLEFDGPKLTAAGKDLFVDHWERVP